jgi:hypothetical protein
MRLKAIAALALSLFLSGCFLTPGAFDSSLDLRRSGEFAFAYKGEVVFAVPDELMRSGMGKRETWSADQAYCAANAEPGKIAGSRPCSSAEIAEQKKVWEAEQVASAKREAEESKKFAAMFGYTPGDDEANRRLATQIAKIDGFRSVAYRGGGVFDVDYAKSGRLDHDFVFPTLLQANVMFPFVLMRMQNDGAVRVASPAFVGNGALGSLARFKEAGMLGSKDAMPPSRTKGRFVVTTDGDILTNNTEDGSATSARGKVLTWIVDQRSVAAPEALIKLR